jgi:hypothetical protein
VILARVPEGLLVVRQADHGDQTGQFAASWGNEEVAPVGAGARPAQLAARHHDDGWALWERRPTLDPATGQPFQFSALPPAEHLPMYRAGIERVAQFDLWAGLLVSMHGVGIYNDRYGTFRLTERSYSTEEQALVDEFLRDMQELQDGLLARSGHHTPGHAADDAEVRHLYLMLQVWDRLSLQFAFRLAADGEIGPLPSGGGSGPGIPESAARAGTAGPGALRCLHDGAFALRLDPYPFVEDDLAFPVTARVVADRPYGSPEEFLEALSGARPTTLDCRVRAGGSARDGV